MRRFALGTRITIWSAIVVALGILLCGVASTWLVHRNEQRELDDQLTTEARRFLEEWQRHGGAQFDWARQSAQADDWVPASLPPRLLEVADLQGRLLYRSKSVQSDLLQGLSPGLHTIAGGEDGWRVVVLQQDGLHLRLAGDLEGGNDLTEELATAFLCTVPVVLLLVFFGGRLIARKALQPIREITQFAERITAQRLGERVPLPLARDEIHRLATVLNDTFDRLEQSFQQATRFSADASHELKTPLTVLRTSVEKMLRAPNLDTRTREGLADMLEETRRLASITDSLLLLARADAGKLVLDLAPGDLAQMVALCAEDAAILMEPKRIQLQMDLPPSAPALIDRVRLPQIVMNLLDNATKYNRAGGRVQVTLAAEGGNWQLSIGNTGPGISEQNAPQLFGRFHRGAHSQEMPGQGLGLSLARELARAHQGDVVLAESGAEWTVFVLTLPRVSASPL